MIVETKPKWVSSSTKNLNYSDPEKPTDLYRNLAGHRVPKPIPIVVPPLTGHPPPDFDLSHHPAQPRTIRTQPRTTRTQPAVPEQAISFNTGEALAWGGRPLVSVRVHPHSGPHRIMSTQTSPLVMVLVVESILRGFAGQPFVQRQIFLRTCLDMRPDCQAEEALHLVPETELTPTPGNPAADDTNTVITATVAHPTVKLAREAFVTVTLDQRILECQPR
ncbi:hypothetical protein PoB_003010000 [Plakobranchus ocellatus]|uniref:Uncharacterized protein n=1 Tax=Plakobranchus ocellatus TaxID=259542 RepID=A0AAV4A610_9GAST|nr:hypothetical protein PoB_003010000 [Plakobranchus ocellatus]